MHRLKLQSGKGTGRSWRWQAKSKKIGDDVFAVIGVSNKVSGSGDPEKARGADGIQRPAISHLYPMQTFSSMRNLSHSSTSSDSNIQPFQLGKPPHPTSVSLSLSSLAALFLLLTKVQREGGSDPKSLPHPDSYCSPFVCRLLPLSPAPDAYHCIYSTPFIFTSSRDPESTEYLQAS